MDEAIRKLPIGIFDSGVGGISVLIHALTELPQERFIYFADSGNAPYGIKDPAEVRHLTLAAADFIYQKGIKALVVACNTATSAAITHLRERYDFPVIGMEPALKPAVELGREGKILVMATPMTLREKKFNNLLNRYRDRADVVPVPCPGLVELIESGNFTGQPAQDYFTELLAQYRGSQIAALVLGCTHYLFVKPDLIKIVGNEIPIVDGNLGTVRNLKQTLRKADLLLDAPVPANAPRVEFYTSGDPAKTISLCRQLSGITENP